MSRETAAAASPGRRAPILDVPAREHSGARGGRGSAVLLDAALAYAEGSLPVVPIVGKRPAAPRGYGSATTDPAEVRELFAKARKATGVGLAAGDALVIADVDRQGAIAELPPLPRTLTARSGGGGWHLYFVRPPGLRLSFRRDRFPAGVEVKLGAAGCVAPPSVHVSGRRYEWARWLPLAAAPDWLLERLRCEALAPTGPVVVATEGSSAYGLAALERKARLVAAAPEGSRRNTLNGAAFACAQLVPSGHLRADAVTAALSEAALATGLPLGEVRRTIARALLEGQARPYFPECVA